MSEFIATTDSSSAGGFTEHSFKRLLAGDITSVRRRLVDALESFNYVVLSDDPLHARRGGNFSMNVLDCALKLTIILRESSPASTTATFNYTIPLSMVTKGDLHTLEREAEALIAVAIMRPAASVCISCGTNNTGDSRFCRGCGAPNTGGVPAEIEVMRLTAGSRAGQQTVVTGVIVLLSILAISIPFILFGKPKGVRVGWVLLVLGQIVGWLTLLFGILRLHRTLNPNTTANASLPMNVSGSVRPGKPASLPPQSAWSSVTEGTTELLRSESEERVATPIHQRGVNTGSVS